MPILPDAATTTETARVTLRGVGLAAGAWTLYGVTYGVAVALFADVPLRYALSSQMMTAAILGAVSLGPWWVVVRGMADASPFQRMAAHAAGAVLYVAAVLALLLAVTRLGGPGAVAAVSAQAGWIGLSTLFAYVTQFAIYHAVDASRRSRVRRAQAETLRHLAREQELRTLHSQLNPHFLFNALTAVSADVSRDPEAARESLGRLADLLRYALDAGRRDTVRLADEVQFTRDYLALEQSRMGERLDVRFEIDAEALGADVPPMVLQTLAENAVRHGIAPSVSGGAVCVSVQRRGAHVKMSVEDTGVGATGDLGSGIGLANTDERLQLLFGPTAALHVQADRASGFAVSFEVPAPRGASVPDTRRFTVA